ncbi:MAG: S41 family peptidase [Pseudomonadota bacterium]
MKQIFAGLVLMFHCAAAMQAQASESTSLSEADKADVLDALRKTLERNYVYEEKVPAIVLELERRLQSGDYRSSDSAGAFAEDLTQDLIEISEDLHFAVTYDPEWIALHRASGDETSMREDQLSFLRRSNYGFRQLKILEGNVGYVRFDYFPDPARAFEAGAGAMRFVENADALIFDVRYNRGGHNQFAQFLSSYLFDAAEHQLLHEYSYRSDGETLTGTYWTMPALPGPRRPEIPVYVLTSTTTFSAAEWFAYALQKLDRAKIVGQQTSGASHAVDRKPVDDKFILQVPVGVGRDPVDKSDFEGVGVLPDHGSQSSKALAVAHKLAIETLVSKMPEAQNEYEWLMPVIDARLSAPDISHARLQRLAGQYEGRKIVLQNGQLVYHWRGRFNLALTPLGPNLFAVEGSDDFRFRFTEKNGSISALERVTKSGRVIVYPRR